MFVSAMGEKERQLEIQQDRITAAMETNLPTVDVLVDSRRPRSRRRFGWCKMESVTNMQSAEKMEDD
jgi:hypothetical protein